jgi:hypothetical protein
MKTTVSLILAAITLTVGVAKAELKELVKRYAGQLSILRYSKPYRSYVLEIYKTADDFARVVGLAPESMVLENECFKIVDGVSEEALSVTDFDGRMALFHLMRAREFFKRLDPDLKTLNEKTVVRVRQPFDWNPVTRFTEYESFNNAVTIPAHPARIWESEIWFMRPRTSIKWEKIGKESALSALQVAAGGGILASLEFPINVLRNTRLGLDSVKQPSIIYHEAFHRIVNTEGLFEITGKAHPLGEDFANYYGSVINERNMIADLGEFNDFRMVRKFDKVRKESNKNKKGTPIMSNFVPSLFWKIRRVLGAEKADRVIWSTMKNLRTGSKYADLPGAFMKALSEQSDTSVNDKMKVNDLFYSNEESLKNLDVRFGM